MFFLKVLNWMPGLHILCKAWRCWWFLLFMNPLLLTSNAVMVVVKVVISFTKCAYLFCLSRCLFSILVSRGQVSLKICSSFFTLSIITISGLRLVTQTSGWIVPPPTASCPGRSLKTDYLLVSSHCSIKFRILLCLHVQRPVYRPTLQMFRH